MFGDGRFMVPWNEFVKTLVAVTGGASTTELEEALLSYIIDASQTNMVNKVKFNDFLQGFGPLCDCLTNLKTIVGAEWFFGFLSKSEAELALANQPRGTFLVRFRITDDSYYAVACVMKDGGIIHALVKAVAGGGFTVRDNKVAGRVFPTLLALIQHYSSIFKKPLKYSLTNEVKI